MKKNVPPQVVNPFSDNFVDVWDLWKQWRKEYDDFSYKGVISEQMALKKLAELCEGIEEKAVLIIEQSIERQWTGFYKVRNSSKEKDGKSAKQTPDDKRQQANQERRSDIQDLVAERIRKRGESESESHLKAV